MMAQSVLYCALLPKQVANNKRSNDTLHRNVVCVCSTILITVNGFKNCKKQIIT